MNKIFVFVSFFAVITSPVAYCAEYTVDAVTTGANGEMMLFNIQAFRCLPQRRIICVTIDRICVYHSYGGDCHDYIFAGGGLLV